jgi:hypothetical protein
MTRSDAVTPRFTLLVRAYCHLCDDMRAALMPLIANAKAEIVELDVDADAALEARYGDDVPALFAGSPQDGRMLARWRFDAAAARALAAALEIR